MKKLPPQQPVIITRNDPPDPYRSNIAPHLQSIRDMIISGLPEYTICHYYGLKPDAWDACKAANPELNSLIDSARAALVGGIVSAIVESAQGIEYDETYVNKHGETVTSHKKMPPNTSAAIFLLKNLDPERWSDRRELPSKKMNIKVRVINAFNPDGTPRSVTMTGVGVDIETGEPENKPAPGNLKIGQSGIDVF